MTIDASRRAFLQRASALVARRQRRAVGAQPGGDGRGRGRRRATDYKALVCVFLYGGNDYGNTLVPYDSASYAKPTSGMRPTLAYAQAALAPTLLVPVGRARRRPPVRARARARAAAAALQRRQARRDAQRRHAGPADDQGAVHRRRRCRCRPSCSRTTTSSRCWQSSVARRRGVGLGRAHGRPVRRRQRQRHLHLRQRLGQRGLPVGQARAVQYQVSTTGPVAVQRHRQRRCSARAACSTALQCARHRAAHPPVRERVHARRASARSTPARVLTAALAGAPDDRRRRSRPATRSPTSSSSSPA